jgi:3-oxoadipate enol-lactonase
MTFTSHGAKLDYTEYGPAGKIPVVFIHGFPFNQAMWKPQVDALQSGFHLITYDHRGHGKSDSGDGQFMLEHLVDDLIGLLDHLKLQKAVLCGLSMGGYVALRAVERNPERVQGLVLCDTRSEADPNEGKLKRAAAIRVVKEKGLPAFVEGFMPLVFTQKSLESKLPAADAIRKAMLAQNPLGVCGTLLALASRTDTTTALPRIHVPTLILVGDQDPITPPAASESMHKAIPGSELHIIPGSSHLSNLENPEAVNGHLQTFLKKVIG